MSKLSKFNPFRIVREIVAKLFICLIIKAEDFSKNPRQRVIMKTSAILTFTGLFASNLAYADGDGFAGMLDKAGSQADSGKNSLGKIFAFLGFGGAGYGGFNMWKKGKEGENSQVKGTQIFVPIVAGAALGAIGYVMLKGGETVGIQASSQGQLP